MGGWMPRGGEQLIDDEDYWRKRALHRWSKCEISGHGSSWKQLYFEKYIEETIERFDPLLSDIDDLRRLLTFASPFVRNLIIQQIPSHIDLQIIFNCMPSALCSLSLSYGMRDVGMDYDRSLFGMKLSDCRSLARSLETAETLTHLNLSNNFLDDDKVRIICSGLVDNLSVTHLDLSHNKIADRGVRAISKLLQQRGVIAFLDLADNQIHSEGGRSLARVLRENKSLISISLRLNRFGDDAGRAICDCVRNNTNLQRLNLSANTLGEETANSLALLLRVNSTLKEVDLSCNQFSEEAGTAIRDAVEENTGLKKLDLRLSSISEDLEMSISEILKDRMSFM